MGETQGLIVLLAIVLATSYLGRMAYAFISSLGKKGGKLACGKCSGCGSGDSRIKVVELVGLQLPASPQNSRSENT